MKYGNSRRGANFSFFDNYYHNYIDTIGLAKSACNAQRCFGYDNLKQVRIFGMEASGNWEIEKNWHSWASFAYSNGHNTDMNYKLASVASFRGIVGFRY